MLLQKDRQTGREGRRQVGSPGLRVVVGVGMVGVVVMLVVVW